jgi:hypothetical protein
MTTETRQETIDRLVMERDDLAAQLTETRAAFTDVIHRAIHDPENSVASFGAEAAEAYHDLLDDTEDPTP